MIQLKLRKKKIKLLVGSVFRKLLSFVCFFIIYLFRACRLRKKAQHEANKLKLHGLNDEHSKSCIDLFCSSLIKREQKRKKELELNSL